MAAMRPHSCDDGHSGYASKTLSDVICASIRENTAREVLAVSMRARRSINPGAPIVGGAAPMRGSLSGLRPAPGHRLRTSRCP